MTEEKKRSKSAIGVTRNIGKRNSARILSKRSEISLRAGANALRVAGTANTV